MKQILLLVTVTLYLAVSAQAQIGWTLKECQAKYGEGTFHKNYYYFSVKGLELGVEDPETENGPITRVTYSSKRPISESVFKKLLQENAPGLVWYAENGDSISKFGAYTQEELKKTLASQEANGGWDFGGEVLAHWEDPNDKRFLTIAKDGYQNED
jgi:hypothetical protein